MYSLEEDGVSLGTLYKKCDELRGLRNGFVLVVRDGDGGVSPPLSKIIPLLFLEIIGWMLILRNGLVIRRLPN